MESIIENMSYTSGNTRNRRVEEQPGSKTNPHFSMGNRYPSFFLFPMDSGSKNNCIVISSHRLEDTHTVKMMKHINKVEKHGACVFLYKGFVLENERFVLRNKGSVSKLQSSVSRNKGSVPENESPVMRNEGFVPENKSLFFRNASVVPQYGISVSEYKITAIYDKNTDIELVSRCFMLHAFKNRPMQLRRNGRVKGTKNHAIKLRGRGKVRRTKNHAIQSRGSEGKNCA